MDKGWEAEGTVLSPVGQLKMILFGSKRLAVGRSD